MNPSLQLPMCILQPFRDMIEGPQRFKSHIVDIAPQLQATAKCVPDDYLALGVANQLTSILVDAEEECKQREDFCPRKARMSFLKQDFPIEDKILQIRTLRSDTGRD